MRTYVLGLQEADRTMAPVVGGKGAGLGELARLGDVRVPDGFCVTTAAFELVMDAVPALDGELGRLAGLAPGDRDGLREVSGAIRGLLEAAPIPADLEAAIAAALDRLGPDTPVAVRSSATAEDLPTASFAGQQDSFLDVRGRPAVLAHVARCWASLFTERAVAYRQRHGFDHRQVRMAVVVQRMVAPQAAGVLFTADPVTGHRGTTAIEAVPGLGEALVAGRVDADAYQVRAGRILKKRLAGRAGGPVLTDDRIRALEALGRRIEAHFGGPQDVEWCLADGAFHVVQARPITTLYPVPEPSGPGLRVYISVGHQQMMTDPMRPLGRTLWQLLAARPMFAAGGRLYVDVAEALAAPPSRDALIKAMREHDPLIGDAVATLVAREDVLQALPAPPAPPAAPAAPASAPPAPPEAGPALVAEVIAAYEASIEEAERRIRGKAGPALLEAIREDVRRLRQLLLDPRSRAIVMGGIEAATWLNERMAEWLGEKGVADVLSQSVPNNVTSEMGLALLDVADAIRPHPDVVAYLEAGPGDGFLEGLPARAGGEQARDAILGFLARYGRRGVGEIDVTRPRWGEAPAVLVPLILGNLKHFAPGASRRKFEQGRQAASAKEAELLARLAALPDGASKAAEARRVIARLRALIGYREFPKYGIVGHLAVYRRALREEAGRLVADGVLRDAEDADFLTLEELAEAVGTRRVDAERIRARRAEHALHEALTPPRVITSDGEIAAGCYRRADLPAGALVGLAVSAGVVEGRARVVVDLAAASLEPGDILVTRFTDPSWTPVFVAIQGLVTEVGGLMTHGAVVAREYGLAAVVGVERATERIRDGQRIRVHGTEGYVELLD